MEAPRATETTLMMTIMSSGMVMRKREQLVSTSSRHNVNVQLARVLSNLTWDYTLQGDGLDGYHV